MLKPVYVKQFNKDIKRSKKRGKDLEKLKDVIDLLVEKKKLPTKNKDHKLTENFHEYRECNVAPNWLLIYKIEGGYIFFVRTGTHSDLFE
ncbi:MAG: type II toxin-antitoxin system YafQ family toxin [Candidatus Omnitrophica bacterium]|nr:type II toxin-antitoxin system YafQ family toxin [Candidatus Omnitrophota bacterium]